MTAEGVTRTIVTSKFAEKAPELICLVVLSAGFLAGLYFQSKEFQTTLVRHENETVARLEEKDRALEKMFIAHDRYAEACLKTISENTKVLGEISAEFQRISGISHDYTKGKTQ